MSRKANEASIKQTYFENARGRLGRLAAGLTDEPEAVVEEAAECFDQLLPEMGYVDQPDHPMAESVFICSANLALYLALNKRGVDVHDFGAAMVRGLTAALAHAPEPPNDEAAREAYVATFIASAEVSATEAGPGEFVYEAFADTDQGDTWGMNVKSCAICAQYAQHDAMDLVPYMCATDDVVSDKMGQGLRRTGTIALGAHQCDFRYGADPLRVAEQYPERIHVVATD